MSDHKKNEFENLPRREFMGSMTAAATALAVAAQSAEGAVALVETDVEIKTPDGTCDAAFIHPKSGKHPGVIIWPDAFGLRPSMRDIAKRIASEGYSVLVPNPFYRVSKAPQYPDASNVNFATERAKLNPLMGSIGAAGAAEKDAPAFVAFLDAQKSVDKKKKIGTQGYCMGGPLVMRTAAAVPDRIGAGATFHGGGLVTTAATSPHLLIPKMHAQLYIAIAGSDDKSQPDAKDKLKEAFAASHVKAEVVVYETVAHGWCVPDMPKSPTGTAIYDKAEADKAWGHLVALYKSALA
jgi:carboxymethylenebutenolidase